jgi:acetyl-CoA carboxylase biotin carboxyl carrier protein
MQLTLTQLESLLRTLEAGGASEFEYEDDKIRLKIALPRGVAPAAPVVRSGAALTAAVVETKSAPGAAADPALVAVTSPFVGTFYRAASPESANFVEVGSIVKAGQTLCIVEAMKLMNEIECEHAGSVVEVLVENGKSVEYGQKLFMIRKAP